MVVSFPDFAKLELYLFECLKLFYSSIWLLAKIGAGRNNWDMVRVCSGGQNHVKEYAATSARMPANNVRGS